MTYDLPTSVEVGGTEYPIRSDYRAILDICIALNDPELDEQGKALVMLDIFYPDFAVIPPEHLQEAAERACWFISCGQPAQGVQQPKLMDWEQDFPVIVAPINRVLGQEIRSVEYLHWWSFISAYYEIGNCLFAQIVRIRDARARGKKLDKSDREWLRNNRNLVDFPSKYTAEDEEIFKQLI